MDYTFIDDLLSSAEVPTQGMHTRVLQKNENVNITLFGFSASHTMSAHAAAIPAIICILSGEAEITLGDDVHHAKSGSFAYMPAHLPHSISAVSPMTMLLIQVKTPAN